MSNLESVENLHKALKHVTIAEEELRKALNPEAKSSPVSRQTRGKYLDHTSFS